MANITLITEQVDLTLNTDTNIIQVTPVETTVTVSESGVISNSAIRAAISGADPIQFSQLTGVISIDEAALFSGKTTDDLAEGTVNLYLNGAGSTTDLTEGANLYYTNARVLAYIVDNGLDFNAEKVDDQVNNLLQAESPLTKVYNDPAGTLTLGWAGTTSDVPESGSNLYYSTARARGAFSASDLGGFGSFQYLEAGGVFQYQGVLTSEIREVLSATSSGLGSLSYNSGTGVIQYSGPTAIQIQALFDATNTEPGLSSLTYSAGLFTYNPVTASEVTALFSADNTLTGFGNVTYANGAISYERVTKQNILDTILDEPVKLKQYSETQVDLGERSGVVTVDLSTGSQFNMELTANLTGINFSNALAGSSATFVIQQDEVGFRLLTGTWANWEFTNNYRTLSTGPLEKDVLTVFYDGTTYFASLATMKAFADIIVTGDITANSFIGDGRFITNVLTNYTTTDLAEGTNQYFTTDRANTAITTHFADATNSPFTINGDLEVAGNIDYVNVVDLLVNDQSITLNYGNATARDAFIYVDRSGSALANAYLTWDETDDAWKISDGTSTFKIPTSTTDLAEGTNLYYTDSRANAAMDAYLTSITANVDSVNGATGVVVLDTDDVAQGITNKYYSSTLFNADLATKTTTDLTEGTNLYYTDGRADARVDLQTGVNLDLSFKSTTDLAEGTNLYYTTDRGNATIAAYQGDISTPGNIRVNTATVDQVHFDSGANAFMRWNAAEGTLDLQYSDSGVTLQIGQEQHVYVKATEAITNGQVVMFAGAQGDRILGALANVNSPGFTDNYILGVATDDIALNELGYVTTFGSVRDVPTTDIGFNLGDLLWLSNSTPGALTNVEPVTPGISILIAAVQRESLGNAGIYFVRPTLGKAELNALHDVRVLAPTDKNILQYTGAYWENQANLDLGTNWVSTGKLKTADTVLPITRLVKGVETLSANIAGRGYSIFPSNVQEPTDIVHTQSAPLIQYLVGGVATLGSDQLTITELIDNVNNITANVGDLTPGYVIDTASFAPGSYITSVDAGNSTVTLNKPATSSSTFGPSPRSRLTAGLIDTDTGLVLVLSPDYNDPANIEFFDTRNYPYGYPRTGPVNTDFDIVAVGTNADYTVADLSNIMVAKTTITPPNGVLNTPIGLTVGKNTDLTNRGENDGLTSFGVNIMWDGTQTPDQFGDRTATVIPQMLFKSYTDGSLQSLVPERGGPRLFFTTAYGNANNNPYETYPRAGQELGRLTFWGTNGEILNESTVNPPGFISAQANRDWNTRDNTSVDMFFAASVGGPSEAEQFITFQNGKLRLGAANNQPITLLPSRQGVPGSAYSDLDTTWATVNYADTVAQSGAKFTVTNGGSSGAGVVGDMQVSLKREANTGAVTAKEYSFVLEEQSADLKILIDGALHTTIKANGEIHNAAGSKYLTAADFNALFDARLADASIDGGGASQGPAPTPDFDGGTASTTSFEFTVDGGSATPTFTDSVEGGNAERNSIVEGGSAGTTTFIPTLDGGNATPTFTAGIEGGNASGTTVIESGSAGTTEFSAQLDGGEATTTEFTDTAEGGNASGASIIEGGFAGTTVYGSQLDGGASSPTFDQTTNGGNA